MAFKLMTACLLFFLIPVAQARDFLKSDASTHRTTPFLPYEPSLLAHSKPEDEVQNDHYLHKETGSDRISLNFQEIKVRAVLQLLADFTGINIVVSDKVRGNITLRLNDIPWDQALDIILTTRALSKRKIGNVMLVAPTAEILDQEKKNVKAKSHLKNLAPLYSDLIPVNYAKANELAALLKEMPASLSLRGNVSADPRTNSLWIQDSKAHLAKIRALVAQLDVPIKQVLIEARIVNVTKDSIRDLGIRFGIAKPLNEHPVSEHAPLAERLNLDLPALPLGGNPASIGIALAKLGNGILLDLELSALESEGRGEIISSPTLITANQQAATIESGEEIPYQEATASGATSVAFKKAVLSLKVTPQITPDASILMDLHINQDIPSVKIFNGVPSILTKEIQTSVVVKDGQTIVLGGIYKQNKYNALNRVPFLGELPVLGHLFRNRSTTIRNEELLIFITPRIITNSAMKKKRQVFAGGVELDKFGRSVRSIH
ncbi:MAG: type IV pilus secretin PilQ [Tatlockia sp.]|jgi:type IV pilus assembly protein PilQ